MVPKNMGNISIFNYLCTNGIFLMFKSKKWHINFKIILTAVFIFVFISSYGIWLGSSKETGSTLATEASSPTPEATPQPTPAPEATPTPTPDATPQPTPTPTPEAVALSISTAPSVVRRNEDATISITGAPNTNYRLRVFYNSESEADGLGEKTSDADGYVAWTWHIGGRTSIGDFYTTISGNGETVRHNFSVAE